MVLLAGWLPGMSDQLSPWSDIYLVIIKKIIITPAFPFNFDPYILIWFKGTNYISNTEVNTNLLTKHFW